MCDMPKATLASSWGGFTQRGRKRQGKEQSLSKGSKSGGATLDTAARSDVNTTEISPMSRENAHYTSFLFLLSFNGLHILRGK
jgi:hypothetical protein